ncbi:MAG: NifU family protein [Anaerovoracaceae bacterium]|nr:NifU family protein [Anaerovoracaceae bacterium]
MEEKITAVLKEKVDPVLAAHYGGAVLAGVEDGTVYVKFTGQCASCPSAGDTLESVVKEILMSEIPEIKDVVLDRSVSEELLDMARKLLNKEM